jgi:ABC-type sugar transport system substrate-binding protein
MIGVRRALSGKKSFNDRLQGQGNWIEHARTPLYCKDDYDRSVEQLLFALNDNSINVVISVGWWPQISKLYREKVKPFKAELLDTNKKIIISADATPIQMEYLQEGLSHVNVGQDFAKMGSLSYTLLKKLANGERIPEYNYTPGKVFRKNK